jgi:hypothetical protein
MADQERAHRMEQWKRSGIPQAWVLDNLDGWEHPVWLSFLSRMKASPFWPLKADDMLAYLENLRVELWTERDRKKLEKQRQQEIERRLQELADQERADRMDQWKRSGMPKQWVLEHLDGWEHSTWMSFLSRMKATPFWPLRADEMLTYLEGLRDELRAERDQEREERLQCEADQAQAKEKARNTAEEDANRKTLLPTCQLSSVSEKQPCERCDQEPRIQGERFCKKCRKAVLAELKEAGYLTRAPLYPGAWTKPPSQNQDDSAGENTSPWQDNAIRALEGD